MIDHIAELSRSCNSKVCAKYEEISAKAMKMPAGTEEMVALAHYIEEVKAGDAVQLMVRRATFALALESLLSILSKHKSTSLLLNI